MSIGVSAGSCVGSTPSDLSSLYSDMLLACSQRPEGAQKERGQKRELVAALDRLSELQGSLALDHSARAQCALSPGHPGQALKLLTGPILLRSSS